MRVEVHPSRLEEAQAFAHAHGLAELTVGENRFVPPEALLWHRGADRILVWCDVQMKGLDVTLRLEDARPRIGGHKPEARQRQNVEE